MKRVVFISIILLFFSACSTTPPPRVENGRYINPKYEFAIDVPEGWVAKDEYPKSFKKYVPYENRRYTNILFFNNKTNGMIVIQSTKTFISYDIYSMFPDAAMEGLVETCEKRKKEVMSHKYSDCFEYEIFSIDYWVERINFKAGIQHNKMLNTCYFYGCHEDDTCLVIVTLMSDVKTFNENLVTYNQILHSLEKGIPVTTKTPPAK